MGVMELGGACFNKIFVEMWESNQAPLVTKKRVWGFLFTCLPFLSTNFYGTMSILEVKFLVILLCSKEKIFLFSGTEFSSASLTWCTC